MRFVYRFFACSSKRIVNIKKVFAQYRGSSVVVRGVSSSLNKFKLKRNLVSGGKSELISLDLPSLQVDKKSFTEFFLTALLSILLCAFIHIVG